MPISYFSKVHLQIATYDNSYIMLPERILDRPLQELSAFGINRCNVFSGWCKNYHLIDAQRLTPDATRVAKPKKLLSAKRLKYTTNQ